MSLVRYAPYRYGIICIRVIVIVSINASIMEVALIPAVAAFAGKKAILYLFTLLLSFIIFQLIGVSPVVLLFCVQALLLSTIVAGWKIYSQPKGRKRSKMGKGVRFLGRRILIALFATIMFAVLYMGFAWDPLLLTLIMYVVVATASVVYV